MKQFKKYIPKIKLFIAQNIRLAVIIILLIVIAFIILLKFLFHKTDTVYVRAKVSQGYWWATTAKPQYWLVNAIKKGDKEISSGSSPKGEIISVRYYPWYDTDQFNIYVILKLKAQKNNKTGQYTYNRTQLSSGAPIDFELSNAEVSATIMEVSDRPINNKLVEKEVVLNKSFAEPWEYDAIQIGDKFYDGEDTVFEVIGKSEKPANTAYTRTSEVPIITSEKPVNIDITVRMKFLQDHGQLYYQEFPLQVGRKLDVRTPDTIYTQYFVKSVK